MKRPGSSGNSAWRKFAEYCVRSADALPSIWRWPESVKEGWGVSFTPSTSAETTLTSWCAVNNCDSVGVDALTTYDPGATPRTSNWPSGPTSFARIESPALETSSTAGFWAAGTPITMPRTRYVLVGPSVRVAGLSSPALRVQAEPDAHAETPQ